MNIQQLEYIIAIDTHRHFAKAAEACFVTQPTMSMMVQKLEEELEVKIFDRSKQPVVPTQVGILIIAQARRALVEIKELKEIANGEKGLVSGSLKIGIIPTLAPYLLPLFLDNFRKHFPQVRVKITEMVTETIVEDLKSGKLDAGLLVTPLLDSKIKEYPLFYEKFFAYVSSEESAFDKSYILPTDIDPNHLWLLEEGHCFRSQIMRLCELKRNSDTGINLEYEAGSIETLMRIIESSGGITIIPELATKNLTVDQIEHVRPFESPIPMREVSLVSHREFVKQRLLDALKKEIILVIPEELKTSELGHVVNI
ncbi:MAG TPA: LysR substrate-binding domain-containing protein [Williamwhitmania sp.]|nr:LysR substrate-binding domain-containing protein [Williamwhitmania sp.]